MVDYTGKKVIARGIQSGVYYGTLVSREGQEVELSDCRNIWFWSGANNLLQLANEGAKRPENSKISVAVDSIVLTDIVEILPCTQAAIDNLGGVPEWRY